MQGSWVRVKKSAQATFGHLAPTFKAQIPMQFIGCVLCHFGFDMDAQCNRNKEIPTVRYENWLHLSKAFVQNSKLSRHRRLPKQFKLVESVHAFHLVIS